MFQVSFRLELPWWRSVTVSEQPGRPMRAPQATGGQLTVQDQMVFGASLGRRFVLFDELDALVGRNVGHLRRWAEEKEEGGSVECKCN